MAYASGVRRIVENPKVRFQARDVVLDAPRDVSLEVREIEARSILSRNDSPDLGFSYSANPYQGCYHGCTYCYARPTHQYLELGAGTDFERVLLVKRNAAALLRRAFDRPSWKGERVVMSGNTDCYQPLESRYGLTRQLLEICLRYQNPVGIITKGRGILRDVSLLSELHARADVRVWVSMAFDDDALRRVIEPFASPLSARLSAIAALSEAGVPTGVAVAPVIPGLNDAQVAPVLRKARDAGATAAFLTPVRLAPEVAEVFFTRLERDLPLRAAKVRKQITRMRNGNLGEGRFGKRMTGHGEAWALVERIFAAECRRLGLHTGEWPGGAQVSSFQRPGSQLALWDG